MFRVVNHFHLNRDRMLEPGHTLTVSEEAHVRATKPHCLLMNCVRVNGDAPADPPVAAPQPQVEAPVAAPAAPAKSAAPADAKT